MAFVRMTSRAWYHCAMMALKWILIAGVLAYAGFAALMYAGQRALQYAPDPARRSPAESGLPAARIEEIAAADGERLVLWHVPPREGRPVVFYFQGNGGGLDLRASRFRELVADGTGLVALNYRGYGGSSGRPSETGLIADARAAHDFAVTRYSAERIVLWGESLGTGVAVALAAERPVARIVLESPFTSAADVAAGVYWFLPVRLLMRDPFHSDRRIARVTAPVLVVHGDRDGVVPIALGERLYGLIPGPKRFLRLVGAGHNDHDRFGAVQKMRGFIAGEDVP